MILPLLKYYFDIRRWEKVDIDKLREMQLQQFKQVFDHARKHSRFYREWYAQAGVLNLEIRSWDDVLKIPVIDKYVLREHAYEDIMTVPISDRLNVHTTSGSTGEPFRIYQTKYEDYTAHVRVFAMLRNIGYHPAKKITMITRYESDDQFGVEQDLSIIQKLQQALGIFQRKIISIYDPPAEIIRQIEADPPYILWSTPSVLDMVATTLQQQRKKWNIPWVVLTSETIFPHQYERFFDRISKNVVSHYGLMEVPTLAYDINDSGKRRVIGNSFAIEFIDERVDDGKRVGTPVVTNLINYTMPFIRYNTHDVGTVVDDKAFPNRVIGRILGRMDDVLDFPDGSQFVHHHAAEMFMDFESCDHYKFIQQGAGPIELLIKPNADFEKADIKVEALNRWNRRFPDYALVVKFVEKFEIHPRTGKFKNIEKVR